MSSFFLTPRISAGPPAPAIGIGISSLSVSGAQGTTVTVTCTLTRLNGYTGNVTPSVSALPAGVTGAFSATPLTGSVSTTVLTLTIPSGTSLVTAAGFLVSFSGSGVTTVTANPTLTVTIAPAISIGATPTSQSVAQGASTTFAVSITRVGGYIGSVTLVASSLTSGVTAAWSSVTSSGVTLTLTAASGATVVSADDVVITGSGSGVADAIAHVALSVTAAVSASIDISVSPATQSSAQGTAPTFTVTLTRIGGYTGSVTLLASSLPPGVTASWSSATLSGATLSTTLTLTIASGATPISADDIVITGSGPGVADAQTHITQTITAPSSSAPLTVSLPYPAATASRSTLTSRAVNVDRSTYAGVINLAVSGLPLGVTGAFVPPMLKGIEPDYDNIPSITQAFTQTYGVLRLGSNGGHGNTSRIAHLMIQKVGSANRYMANFRENGSDATDAPNTAYVTSTTAYPTTRGGWTVGFLTSSPVVYNNYQYVNVYSSAHRGFMQQDNSSGQTDFRFDLPEGAGTYHICPLVPFRAGTETYFKLFDGPTTGTEVYSYSPPDIFYQDAPAYRDITYELHAYEEAVVTARLDLTVSSTAGIVGPVGVTITASASGVVSSTATLALTTAVAGTNAWEYLRSLYAKMPNGMLFDPATGRSTGTTIDTTYSAPTTEVVLSDSGSRSTNIAALQAAITTACGSSGTGARIRYPAGADFGGRIDVPENLSSGWVYVETFGIKTGLLPEGTTVVAADAAYMPNNYCTGINEPAFALGARANRLRLVGLHMTFAPDLATNSYASGIGNMSNGFVNGVWDSSDVNTTSVSGGWVQIRRRDNNGALVTSAGQFVGNYFLDYNETLHEILESRTSDSAVRIADTSNVTGHDHLRMVADAKGTVLSSLPNMFCSYIVLDRCILRGIANKDCQRTAYINGAYIASVNCLYDEVHSKNEGQCFLSNCGPGPYKIHQNTFNAWTFGENLFFGDGSAQTNPTHIQVTSNHFRMPQAWRGLYTYGHKNLLEFKSGAIVCIEGNVFDGYFQMYPNGNQPSVVNIKVSGRFAGDLYTAVYDITFRNNEYRDCNPGMSIATLPDYPRGSPVTRVAVINNRRLEPTTDFSTFPYEARYQTDAILHQARDFVYSKSRYVELRNNTFGARYQFTENAHKSVDYLHIEDNLFVVASDAWWIHHDSGSTNGNINWNDIVGINSTCTGNAATSTYGAPPGNTLAASVAAANLTSSRYEITSSSPFKGVANGGRDPGAVHSIVDLAIAGVP